MGRKSFLDISDTYCLRGIAMLMIIVGHTFNGYPANSPGYYFPSWMNCLHIGLWGGMGVGMFLFLSGYGLFYTLSRRATIDKRYVLSKIRRLFEPFIIYWIVEVIVLALFNRSELRLHLLKEMATLSIHPDVENWFFKVIIGVYIITIVLFKWKMKNAVRLAVLSVLSLIYLVAMKKLGFGQWWYNTILCFPFGAFVAYRYEWFAKLSPTWMSASGCLLLLAIFFVHMNTIAFHLVFVLFCVYAVRLINIQNKVLYFIGFNSFIFYYIECPVMDEIMMFSYANYPVYCVLSVVGTCVLSYLCVKCVGKIRF